MDNYIVRIYRCEKDNPYRLVGVVEEVGVKDNRTFTNYDELWEILNSRKSGEKKDRKGRREGKEHKNHK